MNLTPHQKVLAGAAFLCVGSWLLYEGYEGAGRKRPFVAKLLPGA